MKIPITGNPDIDSLTVKAALAALDAERWATTQACGLRERARALRARPWARRTRLRLALAVRRAARAVQALKKQMTRK